MSAQRSDRIELSEEQWRARLTPEQFRVARQQGTEPPFANAWWNNHAAGVYRCVGCGLELFNADAKYDSGTGWPSFFRALGEDVVELHEDRSHGMVRTEVRCARCGSHLGHLFEDGPRPTGLRYCMNSASLDFEGEPGAGE
ncbi:MAG: peptide-methionine (R)-S-oxide reductase MsrB [Anaerolineae bacterium]|jgi:peptide-methionine (R)-S-oxide reductase|nr:peptide-methionine (R)-S-oxide reductase MsrB [Chloroflexota bacterium]